MKGPPQFEEVVAEGRALQQFLADEGLVAVGGTAAALHCGHRYSLDVDFVTPRLREHYQQIQDRLESWTDWLTHRRNPPVLILGERHGVELGLRQLRHRDHLETTEVAGFRVPTVAEMLRIKAYLMAERRATRDYLDVAALADRLGAESAREALRRLSAYYPALGRQSAIVAFAEACEAEPLDLPLVDLVNYRGIRPPFTDWQHVIGIVRRLGRDVLKRELNEGLPAAET